MTGRTEQAAHAALRTELYERIILETKEAMTRYYREYPMLLTDDRSKEAVAWSMRGIDRILRILDEYEIGPKRVVVQHPPTLGGGANV